MSEPKGEEAERREVQRAQDIDERERKGREEGAVDPAEEPDPRGDREPPQPFSGPER
ncbi:hypothetical protein [Allorhizocola rhizosphaerae]|uniref:hypothetical protein n=1 Tax=Allorhizocola rhizosphaerae TaxID=1872709 RepID=UPI0013C2B63A|nr:hypothetical protein [Allorhizocola rhizosphaerae]